MEINRYKEARDTYLTRFHNKNTRATYEQAFDALDRYIVERSIDDISAAVMTEYIAALNASHSNNGTRLRCSIFHRFFEWARDTGFIDDANPVIMKYIPRKTEIKYDDMLTLDDINTLLAYVPPKRSGARTIRTYAIVTIMLQSGLRLSEILALRLCDVDTERQILRIWHGKGDKYREAPFPSASRIAYYRYMQTGLRPNDISDEEPLFGTCVCVNGSTWANKPGAWRAMQPRNAENIVKNYVKAVTGKTTHCHMLRHGACSIWAERGASMRDVQQALGHSSITTTERVYTHVLNRSASAERINRVFDNGTDDEE